MDKWILYYEIAVTLLSQLAGCPRDEYEWNCEHFINCDKEVYAKDCWAQYVAEQAKKSGRLE